MKKYVKQHFVPRFYLKNFCSPGSEILYCYDKVKDIVFKSNIINIGQENLFYDVEGYVTEEVERSLGRVESRFFSKSYDELLDKKNYNKLSRDNKSWFTLFLAFQSLRTNEFRLRIKELREKVVFEIAKLELEAEKGIKIPKNLTMKFTDPEYIKFLHVDMLWPDLDIFYEIGAQFFYKHWVVLRNTTGIPLWTSDNPISIYNEYGDEGNLGIVSPGVEIRLPLTTNLLLFSYDPNTNPPIKNGSKMTSAMVKTANQYQLRSATRFIYSFSDNFDLASKYLIANPKFRNPKRSRWKVFFNEGKIETIRLE